MAGKCNPSSAAVHTYLGISHKNLHEHREALKEFEIAENLNPENMHNTFHRANLLLTLNEDMKAEKLLTDLVKQCPKEPQVHIQLGKLMKKTNRKKKALFHFNQALDLDPQD